ncbi:MAG: class I SAM-dependent methyltransferase [Hyphomicrobium sp.]|uniref:O-methyltransferase n=1 Tax=Hyphomicrobium sp. TaxID=82 RepID=UPI001327FA5F|nr:class I SAM-dependent methyltransferase [Hyphomicrobium sp.]KAB2939026.1 MAG: class I SAM-dependent methyltransferase [Hyphomicrobium sp.]MBZ0211745.1 class I SAM-dependent methyltransferase [Hyphomicrobium sp.]
MVLRPLIKALLPRSALGAAVSARDAVQILSTPRAAFDARNLRPAADVDMKAIFGDRSAAEAWQTDQAAVASVFGAREWVGGVNPGDRRAIYHLIYALNPRSVLEVGTHVGASTFHIARALRAAAPDGTLTTVDISDVNDPQSGAWVSVGLNRAPRDMLAALDCARHVTFVVRPSLEFMTATNEKYDFIFLDGDHSARAVYLETAAALRLLRPGGLILLHDFYPEGRPLYAGSGVIVGPDRALKRVRRECPDIAVMPVGALPWLTKDGSNVTSLALVAKASSPA